MVNIVFIHVLLSLHIVIQNDLRENVSLFLVMEILEPFTIMLVILMHIKELMY